MIDIAYQIVNGLNALSPLGLAAGLSYIIYQLVARKGTIRTISDNHLSGLPEMNATLIRIEEALGRLEGTNSEIRDGINYLRGRVNGRG